MNIVNFEIIKGHVVHVRFDTGTEGDVDLAPDIARGRGPQLELRDLAVFGQAFLEDGTLRWPNGADFAVEHLHARAVGFHPPKTFEEAKAQELAMSLRELRTDADTRQEDLAAALEVTQGAVSKLEGNVADSKVTTLRRYLKALGWELELVAVKGDKRVRLRGV